jgi:uncharacterized membrane protein YccC
MPHAWPSWMSWYDTRAWTRNHRAELALSLRVTIAALLSFALSNLLIIPLPLWTVLTAVILTQVNFGRSLKATFDYLVGTLGGAIYAGTVAALIPHPTQIALAGVLAIAVAPLALLAAINPTFGAATFTGVLVLLVPGIANVGPVESAVYRVLEVAVGGFTALAVSALVWPTRVHALAIETSAQMLELAAQFLPEFFAGFTRASDATTIGRLQDRIGEAFARLDGIAAEARHERIRFLIAEPDLGPLLRTLLRLRHDLVMIGRSATAPLPEMLRARLEPLLARIIKTVAEYLQQSAAALVFRRGPSPRDALEAVLDEYARTFAAVRSEGLTRQLPVDAVERVFVLSFALEQLRQHLRDLDRCVREVKG